MARLLFYRAEERLLEYRLRPGRTTIGRADLCDVSLPGESISRTHCVIDGRGSDWHLVDRSRHGTTVDGVRPARRAALSDGTQIGIGSYTLVFRTADELASPTAEAASSCTHEALLRVDDGVAVSQARLLVVDGPGKGEWFYLRRPRMTVGGPGSTIALSDPSLARDHCRLRVSRGRVMLEPGKGSTWMDGHLLRDITSVFPDEEFRLGSCVLRVDSEPLLITPEADRFGEMIGGSRAMKKVFGLLKRMAGHDDPILIIGESGTGKELAAHGIHQHSACSDGPFVPINCGAIAADLFESELFGHRAGSFTGAVRDRTGLLEAARDGTLFLDEVGELPISLQAKLLRVLETGEYRPVGSDRIRRVEARIIAATNRDLRAEIDRGNFREDLYFRLSGLEIEVPTLRARRADIPLLAEHFLQHYSERFRRPALSFSASALQRLRAEDWGRNNVRELQWTIRQAVARSRGGEALTPEALKLTGPAPAIDSDDELLQLPYSEALQQSRDQFVRRYLLSCLERADQNKARAAELAGVERANFYRLLRRMGIRTIEAA